jgi:Ca2+/Na+ antiporter
MASLIATGLIGLAQGFLKANPNIAHVAALGAIARLSIWKVLAVALLFAAAWYLLYTAKIRRQRRSALANAPVNRVREPLVTVPRLDDRPIEEAQPPPVEPNPAAPVAKLFVGSHYRDSHVHHITAANSGGKGMAHQSLFVFNNGERAVRDATLLLWIPMRFDRVESFDWKHPDQRFGAFGFKYVANAPNEDGKRYWQMTYDIPFPIYPKAPPRLVLRFPLWVPVPTTDYILWRIYYDDGVAPPEEEPAGRLGVTTMPKR